LVPGILAELFGTTNFAVCYTVIGMATPVGSYLFSAQLTAALYDDELKRGGGADGQGDTCYGVACYQTAYSILAVFNACAALVCGWLAWRTRAIYQHGHAFN